MTVTVAPLDRPGDLIDDDDYGVRAIAFLGGWDLSLNYLYQYKDQSVFFAAPQPDGSVQVNPQYRRRRPIGGMVSNVFGDVTLRSEIGHSNDRFSVADPQRDAEAGITSGVTEGVVGLDYRAHADWLIRPALRQPAARPASGRRPRFARRAGHAAQRASTPQQNADAGDPLHPGINDGAGVVQASASSRPRRPISCTAA
ncbi:hypothetical protein [Algiphilus sp.]|uniref:hypothetical protein n=1 Tax=Algiphilus sp. TaxID=1872431 RepID=UPI0032EB8B53